MTGRRATRVIFETRNSPAKNQAQGHFIDEPWCEGASASNRLFRTTTDGVYKDWLGEKDPAVVLYCPVFSSLPAF